MFKKKSVKKLETRWRESRTKATTGKKFIVKELFTGNQESQFCDFFIDSHQSLFNSVARRGIDAAIKLNMKNIEDIRIFTKRV